MRFRKYQALGNDYLVIAAADFRDPAPALVRRITHRNFGIGADGILSGERSGANGFRLRIYNPDGSEAEKSGNGLRIYARSLFDAGEVGDQSFDVDTPGGRVRCQVKDAGASVRVAMGRVTFDSVQIPVAGPAREVLREPIRVLGRDLEFSAASVGNPHCVIFVEQPSEALARELGPELENNSRFPRRSNVQFAKLLDRANLQIEIWERGAGYTLASGSSACAAAGVSRRLGLCDDRLSVHMPGGVLEVEIAFDFEATIEGPVVFVAEGDLAEEGMRDPLEKQPR